MKIKLLALIASLIVLPVSHAALLTYNYQGYVNSITNVTGADLTTVQVLDTITGSITLDTSVAPASDDGSTILWTHLPVSIDITIGDYTISVDDAPGGTSLTIVMHGAVSFPTLFDSIYPIISNVVDSWEASQTTLFAGDTEGIAFSDLTFPLSFEGADVISGSMLFSQTGPGLGIASVNYIVTSIEVVPVPVPAAIWLLFSALGTLGLRRSFIRL